jgi:hypothetical protein
VQSDDGRSVYIQEIDPQSKQIENTMHLVGCTNSRGKPRGKRVVVMQWAGGGHVALPQYLGETRTRMGVHLPMRDSHPRKEDIKTARVS